MSRRHPESEARMIDVSAKGVTAREAVAACVVQMSEPTRDLVLERALEKGDALEIARVSAIMAAKKTAELIPLCHPIGIEAVELSFEPDERGIGIVATARAHDRTGVEMEAMTAAAVAALTIYDMVKATERGVEISDLRLLRKSGGRSGEWVRPTR